MIADPYIKLTGPNAGMFEWFAEGTDVSQYVYEWQPYADFEREKLEELCFDFIETTEKGFYMVHGGDRSRWSLDLIGYGHKIKDDSESSRLLKRAEFLKAVCEKEGVPWLPGSVSKQATSPSNGDRTVAKVQVHDIPPVGRDVVKELSEINVHPIVDPAHERYTKAEINAHFHALLNFLSTPNCGIFPGFLLEEDKLNAAWDELVARFRNG